LGERETSRRGGAPPETSRPAPPARESASLLEGVSRAESCAVPEILSEAVPAEASAQPAGTSRPDRVDWRRLFAGVGAREVLARLVDTDPLGLRAVVAEGLKQGSYLLDADRLHLRSLARCARAAPQYRGRPPLDAWLAQVVDDALLDILREDAEGERADVPPTTEQLAAYRELARPLGLDPERMRSVCVIFNGLPADERSSFFALLIEGCSLDELAHDTGRSATELARAARRAFEALLAGADECDTRSKS